MSTSTDRRYAEATESALRLLSKSTRPLQPHEVVDELEEQGFRADVGSVALWNLIGTGKVDLSPEWNLSLRCGDE